MRWFTDRVDWEGWTSVGVVESKRELNGKVSVERRCYLSSLPVDVALFARAVRGHWAVENNLPWVLDVGLGEAQSRARTGFAVANLGVARRLALNLLRQDKTPGPFHQTQTTPRRLRYQLLGKPAEILMRQPCFPPQEALRLAQKLEIHHPPKHGSWLNMAEIELSVLARQCLAERMENQQRLIKAVAAWEQTRNAAAVRVDWRFTTADARIKLKHLYPTILPLRTTSSASRLS